MARHISGITSNVGLTLHSLQIVFVLSTTPLSFSYVTGNPKYLHTAERSKCGASSNSGVSLPLAAIFDSDIYIARFSGRKAQAQNKGMAPRLLYGLKKKKLDLLI